MFACDATEGPAFEFSKKVELAFGNDAIIELSRKFTCEKVCVEKDQLLRHLPQRAAMDRFIDSLKQDQVTRPMLAVLSARGDLIQKVEKPIDALALQSLMKKALDENEKLVASATEGASDSR